MLTEIAASFWFSTVRWTRVKEKVVVRYTHAYLNLSEIAVAKFTTKFL